MSAKHLETSAHGAGWRRSRPEHYVEIFEPTHLSDFVGVFPDEESALKEASVT